MDNDYRLPVPYGVYVRVDDEGRITAINSDAFLTDLDGWTHIDDGDDDRCHHAQGNYLPGPLMDMRGIYRYKLVEGVPVERSAEEMEEDYTPLDQTPTAEDDTAAMLVDHEYRLTLLELGA